MDSFRHEMELKRHHLRPHEEKVDLRIFSKVVLGLERRCLLSLLGRTIHLITQHPCEQSPRCHQVIDTPKAFLILAQTFATREQLQHATSSSFTTASDSSCPTIKAFPIKQQRTSAPR
ncbi:hypothetical protein DY000_02022964 [Brassica cretica]|uniref:Uncharacterized protein n=1 Tax=Brassica cretica TaxID=69181 RepID=A0ABQ7E1J3_BRACR|nr:hypothetical protein DY000_02022964 [Brassica cretica]